MFDALLKSILSGEQAFWPETASIEEESRFLAIAEEHGIQSLLYHQLKRSGSLEQWPERIRDSLRSALHYQNSFDLLWQEELKALFTALAASDVFPILMKGTPLSYTHYPSPGLRPRGDTDLFIQEEHRNIFDRTLIHMGYHRANVVSGNVISYQTLYEKQSPKGFTFAVDGHWKINNIQLFSDLLSYDEVESSAVALPDLSHHARMFSPAHALLLACIHRVAHHENSERLIWLYDIHLIAEKMERSEFERFAAMAAAKELSRVCLNGLTIAKEWFHTQFCEDVIATWPNSSGSFFEPSAQYMNRKLRRIDSLKFDFEKLRGWNKLQLLKELIFPPTEYMLRKYSVSNRLLLPALYLHRAWTGYRKFVRRVS